MEEEEGREGYDQNKWYNMKEQQSELENQESWTSHELV